MSFSTPGSSPEPPMCSTNASPAPSASSSGGGGPSAHHCVPLPKVTVPLVDIMEPNDQDVLCGRGGAALRHPGNRTYRQLVNMNKPLYSTCVKAEKLKISRSIVAAIREQNGRFLERASGKDPEGEGRESAWYDIGDKKAVEKTSQALREGQPKLRRKMAELEGATGASSVTAARALAAASGEAAASGADCGPAISLVTQVMAPGALTSEEGRCQSVGSNPGGSSVGGSGSVLSSASTVPYRNLAAAAAAGGGNRGGLSGGASFLNGALGTAVGNACASYGGTAAAAHAHTLSYHGVGPFSMENGGERGMPPRMDGVMRTPSGTPYAQVGGEDAAGGSGVAGGGGGGQMNDLMLSEDSLRRLKMEHGIPLSDESYHAMGMDPSVGMHAPIMDRYAPEPISAEQEAEIMRQNTRRESLQTSNFGSAFNSGGNNSGDADTHHARHNRQDTLTMSNVSDGWRPPDGLRGALKRMGKLPSIRTRLGTNMDFGIGCNPGDSNHSRNAGTNASNMSLMSDFSAVGSSAASFGLAAGMSMDVGGGDLNASIADLAAGGHIAAAATAGRVSVWDASESARDIAAMMPPNRQLIRAARENKILSYMADARSSSASTGAASVGSGTPSVDSRREMFAKMRKKARGPLPRTIITAAGSNGQSSVGDGWGSMSGASIGMSKASVDSGLLSISSGMMLKQSFNTRGTGSISTLSWKSGGAAAAAAAAAASPENLSSRIAAAGGAGRTTEPIAEDSHISVDSFGMAVDDMLGMGAVGSGHSVTSNFSRMSLMSDFDHSLDFSSKDFSSRDYSHASTASRNITSGSSGGASSSGRSTGSRVGNGRGQMLGTIYGSNDMDDFDDVN